MPRQADRAQSASPPDWAWWLSRPLATDEHQARFWADHVRIGVVLTELAVLATGTYAFAAHRPQRAVIAGIAVTMGLLVPLLLAVPMRRWSVNHRGALVFYAWSLAQIVFIAVAAAVDGGADSPLVWLLVLTLTFAGLAYPPLGVLIVGSLLITAYLALVAVAPAAPSRSGFVAAVLAMFTMMTAWGARNRWDMADQHNLDAQRLAVLADTDELTGCLNRRAFAARLQASLAHATTDHPMALALLDLDGFKAVNDTRGHAAGDQVLQTTARALLAAARETDSVCRLGGDEFAVLLAGTSPEAAAATVRRLREQLAAALAPSAVTASIGVVTTMTPVHGEALLALADQTMYQAKTNGPGRIHHHHPS